MESSTCNLRQIDERGRRVKIILTAERALMSKYHDNEFLGFGATAP